MIFKPTGLSTGQSWAFWPVLLILLAGVLVPTACVLWFMNVAMRNEHLAVRQRLTDVYHRQLLDAQKRLDQYWAAKLRALDDAGGLPAAEAFKTLVKAGAADALIVYDASGQLVYPLTSRELFPPETMSPQWEQAQGFEQNAEYPAAIKAYDQIAKNEANLDRQAQALQAKARCLVLAGNKGEAANVLTRVLAEPKYQNARDRWGRLIVPDALMYGLRLSGPRGSEQWSAIKEKLMVSLNNYKGPAISSAQRQFLMTEFEQETGIFMPLLRAEQLAAEYLEADLEGPTGRGVRPAKPVNLWTLTSSDRRIIGLITEATVAGVLESSEPDAALLVGAELITHYGPSPASEKEPFLSVSASEYMPDWHMSLYLDDPELFTAAAKRQKAVYLWTGGAGVLVIVVLSLAVATYVGRQIKLTRLKNDLIATVSHELKTPLASMRVLVDTLREGRCKDEQQTQQYFELIAKENERLSRLIDNFLTFSRMERNKQAFEFTLVDMVEIVQAAIDAVQERFTPPQSQLELEVADELPQVCADRDAIMTVIINLLDNAWKYSGDHKLVKIRVYPTRDNVIIEISDNGMGMSRRIAKRIFDKFYQVDQTLSRKAGGCGLGLSIVTFILDAHGGTIDVSSQVGKGSTFTIQLPAANTQIHGQ